MVDIYGNIIDERIAALRKSIADSEAVIAGCQAEIEYARLRLDELLSLQAKARTQEHGDGSTSHDTELDLKIPAGGKTTDAIIALLKIYREGLPASAVVSLLEDRVRSKSKDKAHMIRTTLHNMKTGGRILLGPDKRYRVTNGQFSGEQEKDGFF